MNTYTFCHKLLNKISMLKRENMMLEIKNNDLKLQQSYLIKFFILFNYDIEYINDILNGKYYTKEVK